MGFLRTVGAVVGSLVTIALLMIATNTMLTMTVAAATATFLGCSLPGAVIYHLCGGYLCAALAADARAAAVGLILAGTVLMAIVVAQTWSNVPHRYSIAMLGAATCMLWLGVVCHRLHVHGGWRRRPVV